MPLWMHLARRAATGGRDLTDISWTVRRALHVREPVVALETSLFTHGHGAEGGQSLLHEVVRDIERHGATPAIVGVLAGKVHVSDSAAHFEPLFEAGTTKLASRDLCTAMAGGKRGATTVSATLSVSRQLGIRVQMTGGIGGVHRGHGRDFDMSADLIELSHSGVALVSCGAKPILDLAATLEALEAVGVPVIGWDCCEFPALLTNRSNLLLDHHVATAADAARVARMHWRWGDGRGILFAVPVPHEAALASDMVAQAVTEACEEARRAGIGGPQLTPFLVHELDARTRHASTATLAALTRANGVRAARLAVEIAGRKALSAEEREAVWGLPWGI